MHGVTQYPVLKLPTFPKKLGNPIFCQSTYRQGGNGSLPKSDTYINQNISLKLLKINVGF